MDIIWKGYKNEALKITYKNVIFVVSLFVKGKKLISYRAVLPIKTERAKVYKKKKNSSNIYKKKLIPDKEFFQSLLCYFLGCHKLYILLPSFLTENNHA